MGIMMANQRFVSVRDIHVFKENLQLLLITTLFLLLSAKINLQEVEPLVIPSLLFTAGLVLIVRPVSVLLSAFGQKNVSWRDTLYVGFMAPRGIVAVAISSIFASELIASGYEDAWKLVPLVILTVIWTVACYGLMASPMAKLLKVCQRKPSGLIFLGANGICRVIPKRLNEMNVPVLLIDSNHINIYQAHQENLSAIHGNILSEKIIESVDFSTYGYLLALTPNDEVNALAIVHFKEFFKPKYLYQLTPAFEKRKLSKYAEMEEIKEDLLGMPLFGTHVSFNSLIEKLELKAQCKWVTLTETLSFEKLQKKYGPGAIMLFSVNHQGESLPLSPKSPENTLTEGTKVLMLLDPQPDAIPAFQRREEDSPPLDSPV
jgi:hypothetical protein